MKLKELKSYINKLIDEFDEFEVVNGEVGVNKSDEEVIMVNNPVITIHVDKDHKEVQLFHQTHEDVKDLLINKNNGDTKGA